MRYIRQLFPHFGMLKKNQASEVDDTSKKKITWYEKPWIGITGGIIFAILLVVIYNRQ